MELVPWENPDDVLRDMKGLAIRVLNDAAFSDVHAFERIVGTDFLRQILLESDPLLFSSASWSYWHLAFDLPKREQPDRCVGIRPILDKEYGGWYS